jgi:hypothetical protein
MNQSNDEQVAAILARGVARVRAMDAAGETVADVEAERCVDADEAPAKEQQHDTQTEATR